MLKLFMLKFKGQYLMKIINLAQNKDTLSMKYLLKDVAQALLDECSNKSGMCCRQYSYMY